MGDKCIQITILALAICLACSLWGVGTLVRVENGNTSPCLQRSLHLVRRKSKKEKRKNYFSTIPHKTISNGVLDLVSTELIFRSTTQTCLLCFSTSPVSKRHGNTQRSSDPTCMLIGTIELEFKGHHQGMGT